MTTGPRYIETPFGSEVGTIWQSLSVLGVSSFLTQTGNQPNDFGLNWSEVVDINVPVGTLLVVPAINLQVSGHGSLDPEFSDPLDNNAAGLAKLHDRPFGIGRFSVSVTDVNETDESKNPPEQTAQLLIKMHLADYNLDDPWWGWVGYTLIFFGVASDQSGAGRGRKHAEPRPIREQTIRMMQGLSR